MSPAARPDSGLLGPLGLACLALGLALAGAGGLACGVPDGGADPVVTDPPVDPAHPPRLWEGAFWSDGAALGAIAYEASGPGPHPTVVLLHGFPGNERNLDLAHALRRGGWNVVFFHYRGAWGSEGDFAFVNALEDVLAVVRQVRAPEWAAAHRVDPDRVALVGHSMGGFMALAAATESAGVECAVGLAAADLARVRPAEPGGPAARRIAERFQSMLAGKLAGTSGMALVAELDRERLRLDLRRRAPVLAERRVLLVAGARDEIVPPAAQETLAEAIRAAGGAPEVLVLDADHGFSSKRIALARAVLGFLDAECR